MPSSLKTGALSPREREILVMIALGDSLPEIARKLHRSLKTIESHRLALGRKLNISNRVDLAKIAIAEGLVSLKDDSRLAQLGPGLELNWLSEISEAVRTATGKQYINALCNAFSHVFGVKYAAVCLSAPSATESERFTVSLSEHGKTQPSVYYTMDVTPVGTAIDKGKVLITDGLAESYPEDQFVAAQQLRSYLGLRLDGDYGNATGVMSVMDDKPIAHAEAIERTMRFSLARTSAELERVHKTEEIEALRRLLAMQDQAREAETAPGSKQAQDDISRINLTLGHLTGTRYLSELTDLLSTMLGVRFAGACIRDQADSSPGFMTVSPSDSGRQADMIRYPMSLMPCARTFERGFYCVSSGVAQKYPEKQTLSDLGIQSYCGVRLHGHGGKPVGVMWVMDNKPFTETDRIERVLRFCAARAGSEAEQLAMMDELRKLRESMESMLSEQANEIKSPRTIQGNGHN